MASTDAVTLNQNASNNPLTRKLNKILDTRLDNDKELLEALKGLSAFFSENNLRTRRNLRSDIERKSLSINEEFAEAFRHVKDQLDAVHKDVDGMAECCDDMLQRLQTTKEQTHELITKTTKLQAESQRLEMQAKIADTFLQKFQLTPEEIKTLRGARDGSLNENFFAALARVKQIHNECKILLRTKQQTAGLEIMESMALHQEAAYERLYRWTQGECRVLNGDSPDISPTLCQAMAALYERPVLFQYSLDEFATARRNAVVKGFIDALTRGGPDGIPRPIEMHSHDAMRYLGDMLAWLHQASASEREHLHSLLRNINQEGLIDSIQQALGHITEGICRPLKVRIEQVVVSEPGPVVLYKLTNLLKFYHHTISKTLQGDATLLTTIREMHELSHKLFFSSLNLHTSKLMDKVELPPVDLGPTTGLTQSLTLLREVLESHDASVLSLDDRKEDFKEILGCVVDPLMQMCSVSASRLTTVDMAVYMLNSIYLVYSTLSLYEFTDLRLEMLQAQIDAHIDTLVSEQASHVLNRTDLVHVYGQVQVHKPKLGPLSNVTGLDSISLKSAISKFDSYLSSPDSFVMSQLSLILSPKIRDNITKQSVELICAAYGHIYTAVNNPSNDYKEPRSIMPRTPDQVEKLLK